MNDAGAILTGEPDQAAVFLARLTHDFASSLHIDATLKHAIGRFMVYLNAEAASIFLLDENDTVLICRECAGPVDIRGLRLAPDQGIVGQTVQHNEPKIVRDVARNPSFAAVVDADTGFATRSILCAPLSVRGKCLGALELLNKRTADGLFDMNDMQLATTVASAAALAIHNARMAEELVEQERVRKELELARQIQESLLPRPQLPGFPIHGLNIPAREVSGDFYDFLQLPDGRIYFALADVSGKGMNAALLMAKTTSVLRCLAKTEKDAGTLLTRVNEEVCETATMGMFVTIVAGYLSADRREVELANGGHHPPLLHCGPGIFETFAAEEPPIGILPGIDYPCRRIALNGGALYLYTDGLSESTRPDGSELDDAGLRQMLEASANVAGSERLPAIVDAWRLAGLKSHDDITLVLVESTVIKVSLLELRFPADPKRLKMVREQVQLATGQLPCTKKLVSDIVIAVNEACMNIMEHAYKGDRSGEIVLEINNNDGELEIVLTDFAEPVDFARIRPRPLDDLRPGGLGTYFINEIMDECDYTHLQGETGNVLRMTKRLAQ